MRPAVEDREIFTIKRIAGFNSSVLKDAAITICVALFSGKEIDFAKWITRNIRELEKNGSYKFQTASGYRSRSRLADQNPLTQESIFNLIMNLIMIVALRQETLFIAHDNTH